MLDARSRAVLETLLPGRGHPAFHKGLFDAGFDRFHDDFMRSAPRALRLGLKAALWTAAWAAPLLIGRIPPITRLDPGERERALAAMQASRFYAARQLILLLKLAAGLCYGADPEVRRAIGFPLAPPVR